MLWHKLLNINHKISMYLCNDNYNDMSVELVTKTKYLKGNE